MKAAVSALSVLTFSVTLCSSLRRVHYRPCDQGDEQQLAPGLLLLRYLPGGTCGRWICEKCWTVSPTAAAHPHFTADTLLIKYPESCCSAL